MVWLEMIKVYFVLSRKIYTKFYIELTFRVNTSKCIQCIWDSILTKLNSSSFKIKGWKTLTQTHILHPNRLTMFTVKPAIFMCIQRLTIDKIIMYQQHCDMSHLSKLSFQIYQSMGQFWLLINMDCIHIHCSSFIIQTSWISF
jgi:hypothetical protein